MAAKSDEELRERLLESYRTVSNGTNQAFYHQQAMSHEGITSAKVLPRSRGVGTVDVVVTGSGAAPSPSLLEEMRRELQALKEINVDVAVRAAAPKAVDLSVEIQPEDSADYSGLAQGVKETLTRLLKKMEVGEDLPLARLYRQVMEVEGIANCRILLPGADIKAQEDEVVTLGTVTVARMEVQL